MSLQNLPHLSRDGPQVLTDDQRFTPQAFQAEDFDQVFEIIPHITPLGRSLPLRDPEETEEFHHVIDPQGPTRPAISADFIGQQAITLVPVFFPVGRLKAPVLSQGSKIIGRRPGLYPGY